MCNMPAMWRRALVHWCAEVYTIVEVLMVKTIVEMDGCTPGGKGDYYANV